MSSSQDRILHLTQKLVEYTLLFQECSDQIRGSHDTSAMNVIYEEAVKEWESDPSNPVHAPPLGDENEKAACFAKCDEICRSEPKTKHDLFKISFACSAAMQLIHNQELAGMGDEKSRIIGNANRLAAEQYLKEHPDQAVFPTSGSLASEYLNSVLFPGRASGTDDELGPHLIDQRVRFRDSQTGKIMECTVQDCGTSHAKGDWYEVVYDDETEMQVTAKEMKEMLANRVDEVLKSVL